MEPIVITLSRPVEAHGEAIKTLSLREPNAGDIKVCGYPLQISDGAAIPVAGAICKYIARLANVPPSTVDKLTPADFNACLTAIVDFFGTPEASQPLSPANPD